jgi:lactate 2-monooxygenase
MSPIGCQTLFHPEGEEASARAAGKLGIPFTISTASTRSLEEVAVANGNGERWYQFYWCGPPLEKILYVLN